LLGFVPQPNLIVVPKGKNKNDYSVDLKECASPCHE